jgi:prolyl-tRNA synthetase
MRCSQYLLGTQKSAGEGFESISHELCIRAGLIHQVAAGLYDFLPLGQRVINKIESVVRKEMDKAGALEISMPIAQPAELWKESGRWEVYGDEMLRLKNREGREFCLSPTHEEVVTQLVRASTKSYRDFPLTLYQIGRKFRDELRARHGLLRAREFLMKDAYSFDTGAEGLDESYAKMRDAYIRIFRRLGVSAIPTQASTGEMGGKSSEEFLAEAASGEDKFVIDEDGISRKLDCLASLPDEAAVRKGIEIGHIFKLGTRYSDVLGLKYMDKDGASKPVVMGCYGIGISRMVSVIIEQNHDDRGILWPREAAPFEVVVIPIRYEDPEVRDVSETVYSRLKGAGIDVLLDDRVLSPGERFRESDLVGFPYKLVVSPKTVQAGNVELERRSDKRKELFHVDELLERYLMSR